MNPPSFLAASCYVFIGGGIGAWLRFLIGRLMVAVLGPIKASAFPWGTLTANVLGSFAMGLLVGWLARYGSGGPLGSGGTGLLLGVGLLGGFTTFSSFSLEFALMVERGTIGHAAIYVAISLLAGFLGLFAGLYLMRTTI